MEKEKDRKEKYNKRWKRNRRWIAREGGEGIRN
jgi:hypothetical protein